MLLPLSLLAVGLLGLGTLAVLLQRRQREAEERAGRLLTRLRHRRAALADRHAEIAREVGALYGHPPSPSPSRSDR